MAGEIQELHTSVDIVDSAALLTPEVLNRIVEAVLQRIDARDRDNSSRGTERDLRSVVQQQRAPRGRSAWPS